MSYVEIFRVRKNGAVESFNTEARNNHGGAPLIWDKLIELYGLPKMDWSKEECTDPLFEKSNFEKYSREHKILLLSTCDRVWIKREIIAELITAYRNFHNQFVRDKYVDTIYQMANIIENWNKVSKTDIGIAFNMCSAIDPFWYIRRSKRSDRYSRYNVFKDKEQPEWSFYPGKRAWELTEHMKQNNWL